MALLVFGFVFAAAGTLRSKRAIITKDRVFNIGVSPLTLKGLFTRQFPIGEGNALTERRVCAILPDRRAIRISETALF
jgi:hypothetical protein